MYLLRSFSCQINMQFHWTRKLAPLTVVFLVSYHPRFHHGKKGGVYLVDNAR